MKLATLKDGSRDGRLVVVSRDLRRAVAADRIASSMLDAVERWNDAAPGLAALYEALNAGTAASAFDFDPAAAAAPLPRAPQWCDGSVFLNHSRLIETAFNVPAPPEYDRFRVTAVDADTPGAQSGLQRGDMILEIDTRPAKDFTLDEARQLFRSDGRRNLVIDRGGRRAKVVLELKRF